MTVKKFVTLLLILLTTNLIGQDSLKLKLPPLWLNSLYLSSVIEDGVEHFEYAYKDKKLKNLKYSILLRIERQKKEVKPFKNEDFRSNEGDDLAESDWEMSKGTYTGFESTGFFEDGYKNGFWKTTFNNKLVKTENWSKGLMVGRYRVYDKDGQIRYKTTFGPKGNGLYRDFYYETGVLKEEGYYKNGKKEGEWCTYDEKGEQTSDLHYDKGLPKEAELQYSAQNRTGHDRKGNYLEKGQEEQGDVGNI